MKSTWRSAGRGGALIVLLTVVVYLPALRAGFVWDDDDHLTANPAMTAPHGLRMIWSSLAVSRYYPLTLTTFWVQRRLWGLNPMPYHAVNVLLHAANGLLAFLVLRRLRIPAAWWAAAWWAVHPVNVESVAWVTELKNTQSGFFFFCALLCYLRFESQGQRGWYVSALLCGMAAVLSKPSTVVLPLALLLCVGWQRGDWRWRDVVRVAPFFAVVLPMSALAIVEQHGHVLRLGTAGWSLGIAERLALAGRAIWFYAGKDLWPARLAFVYPRWAVAADSIGAWVPLAGVVGVGIVLWARRSRRWGQAGLFGLGYFVCALLPVLGFFDVYYFRYSFVADHFQYLASVAVTTCAAMGLVSILNPDRRWSRTIENGVGSAVLVTLAVLTWRQSRTYVDAPTLYRRTIQLNPECWMAYNNLGLLLPEDRADEALELYRHALRLNPDFAEAHYNLGLALVKLGRGPEAMEHWQQAVRLRPNYPEAHYNMGKALQEMGNIEDAIGHYKEVLRLEPEYADAHYNLAVALWQTGRVAEAMGHWEEALRIEPDSADAHYFLGRALALTGRMPEAMEHWRQALRLKPNYAEAHYDLGVALVQLGRVPEAMEHWAQAIRLKPDYAEAHYNLGLALEKAGRVQEAIGHYEQALRIKPDYASARDGLARLRTVP